MEQSKRNKSRDAARQRRGKQNGEFGELACQLPLPKGVAENLDRLCTMRLSNSFIKIKHVLKQIIGTITPEQNTSSYFNACIPQALGGFIFVLNKDGQCLYISPNIKENLGLNQLDMMGDSFYKYVQPCDQATLAEQIGGQVPLEDMEIFDGLFCSEAAPCLQNPKKKICDELKNSPYRSFFLRMKSTLTSRGKNVNINASTYRVVHCTGTIKNYKTKLDLNEGFTQCLLAIGNPLLTSTSVEFPIDRKTFISKHSLDMKIFEMDNITSSILGYSDKEMLGYSWYIYIHLCDTDVVKACHETLLKKGQSVSAYYRVLHLNGGWLWLQTIGNVVYLESNGQPQYIFCMHTVVSGLEAEGTVLSTKQLDVSVKRKHEINNVNVKKSSIKEIKVSNTDLESYVPVKIFKEKVVEKSNPHYLPDSPRPPPPPQLSNNMDDELSDSDIPDLEFLDYDDVGVPLTENFVFDRSPYVPSPMADVKLKVDLDDMLKITPKVPFDCIESFPFDDKDTNCVIIPMGYVK
ncbi:hypoxia-inducible factor 1-alpha isoform X1 [Hydra vulgaris]|uniref:Hypoxia-inducible factor 1-alpha n=1 Tax=Hydra vulgaris TaxID=6087 RepID=T2MD63_HYDVU|nr:hypoxia-inducible factor 1-alpha isoform X1 [Hydra vulgaris]